MKINLSGFIVSLTALLGREEQFQLPMEHHLRTPETDEEEELVLVTCPHCGYNKEDTIFSPHNIIEIHEAYLGLACWRCAHEWKEEREHPDYGARLKRIREMIEEMESKHWCGLQGFGQSVLDVCPTCERNKKNAKLAEVD